MSKHSISLEAGETSLVELTFVEGGFLGFLLTILGPLLGADKTAAAVVTDQRICKRRPNGTESSVALTEIERVYRNTSSDSLAVVATKRDDSLLIARVANCDAVMAALKERGVSVEDEAVSPKRRFLK